MAHQLHNASAEDSARPGGLLFANSAQTTVSDSTDATIDARKAIYSIESIQKNLQTMSDNLSGLFSELVSKVCLSGHWRSYNTPGLAH